MSVRLWTKLFINASDFAPASSKAFLDIQTIIETGFTLKRVRDMTRTYSTSNHSLLLFIWWTRFSDICTILELKELNWLCKHMENVRTDQPCIWMIFVLNSVKHKFFHVSIVTKIEHIRNNLNRIVWHLVKNVIQPVFACSKPTIKTQDQGLKSVKFYQWRQHNDIQFG